MKKVKTFVVLRLVFFVFKQKTAYEMRISDWSSDVCSSDLLHQNPHRYDHCRLSVWTLRGHRPRALPRLAQKQDRPDRANPPRANRRFRAGRSDSRARNGSGIPPSSRRSAGVREPRAVPRGESSRSEEHPSELQSLMRI